LEKVARPVDLTFGTQLKVTISRLHAMEDAFKHWITLKKTKNGKTIKPKRKTLTPLKERKNGL
jgi:hypothetical protein